MTGKIFYLLLLFFTIGEIAAQDHDHHEEHEHHHEHEIGASVAPVYFTKAGELSFGTHFHYTYNFPHTKFGLGLGYERIFDEHKHNFIGLELSYRILHPLSINFSPGLSFEDEHKDEKEFDFHFETVYEFEFNSFHIGPVMELAYHPEDFHISLGVHIGLGL